MIVFILAEESNDAAFVDRLREGDYFPADEGHDAASKACTFITNIFKVEVTKPFPTWRDLVITEAVEEDFADDYQAQETFREWRLQYEMHLFSEAEHEESLLGV